MGSVIDESGMVGGGLPPGRLRRVCDFVWEHLEERIRLSDLAAQVGLSPYHFLRAFKAATGQTPHAYVLGSRIAEAKRLLTQTDDSLAEIAAAVGFSSQSHLATQFRRATGVTPGTFRRCG
jgi:AraC family transcriptional regulator